jgi:DNA-binding PadR family transcriptional regulator
MQHGDLAEVGVLGVLNERGPRTLDDVKRTLQHSFGRYYAFSTGVVTPAIQDLVDDECIAPCSDEGQYRYRITDEGRKRLRRLVLDGLTADDVGDLKSRARVMIYIGFLHHLPEGDQAEAFESVSEALRDQRRKWREARHSHDAADEAANVGYRKEMVELNIQMVETFIEWLERLEIRTLDTSGEQTDRDRSDADRS